MNFKVHFIALAVAFAALLGYGRLPGGQEIALGNFALYGALHALCVSAATAQQPGLVRRALLIVLAAVADVCVMYLGIFAVGSFAYLLSAGALYAALGVCALVGAIFYGLLLRTLLFPALRPRRILQIAVGCVAASLLVQAAGQLRNPGQLTGMVGVWWVAFSSGLWFVQRRFHALGAQTDAQDLRRPAA